MNVPLFKPESRLGAGRFTGSALLCCALISGAEAADITVSGNWFETVDQADLAAGAGSDLRSPIESNAGQATLDIANTLGGNWTVRARKSETFWPSGVSVAVKRTSEGNGTGSISGGTAYLTLTGTDQTLFTGTGDRSGVQLQLQTDDLSVSHAPDNYSLTITYTVE
jgi:hypothetical protein